MLNVVALMGRLVADPELRSTQSGINVCKFRIACDRNYAPQGQERQADFIDIVVWRQQAEFVCKYFSKGSLIALEGSLQTRTYKDKNGNSRTATEVVARNINFAGAKKQPGGQAVDEGGEAPPSNPSSVLAYSQGSAEDFAVISDDDDLPF